MSHDPAAPGSRPAHTSDTTAPGETPGAAGPPSERPLGLSLLIWLLWFIAGAIVLLFLGLSIGEGPVMLSGRAASRPEALAAVFPVLLPMGLAAAGGALALGLDRPWARPAVLLPFALAAVAPGITGTAASGLDVLLSALILLPVLAALYWYLYVNREVTAWFAALRSGSAGGGTPPASV